MTLRYFISDAEVRYREQRKKDNEDQLRDIATHNDALVGDLKKYKGIKYQMKQRGTYTCLGLPPLSGLDGEFTSTAVLHQIIDRMEREGALPRSI